MGPCLLGLLQKEKLSDNKKLALHPEPNMTWAAIQVLFVLNYGALFLPQS